MLWQRFAHATISNLIVLQSSDSNTLLPAIGAEWYSIIIFQVSFFDMQLEPWPPLKTSIKTVW